MSAQESTIQPFATGDVFVGATLLNNPDDDHAGIGRILQYDADLNEKGVLWVQGTTHLVYGLTFGPDGTLWAFDPWQWLVIRVDTNGEQLPNKCFAERAFSMVHFAPDGTLYFTESLDGDNQPKPLTTRHKPLPGHTTKLGDGDIYRFSSEGELLQVFDPEVHGGMSGSMAVTHSVMSSDNKRIIYVSETGPRLMQYDIIADRQLPDLRRYAENQGEKHFDLVLAPDRTLLVCMGNRVDALSEDGDERRSYPLPGVGWSIIASALEARYAYVGNWFSGEVIKLDVVSGESITTTSIAEKCMAGIAQYIG